MSIRDQHICKNSVESEGETVSDPCLCPPEYYCVDYCGEETTISSIISWQHFPRSTSSRSRCDDSSEEVVSSLTDTTTPCLKSEEKKSTEVSLTVYPLKYSFSQLQALHYLEIRYVFDFFNYLISQLVCNEPEDPVRFLVDLLTKCLKFRDEFGEPPLLFTHAHVTSLYNAFDPFERGYLTVEQYHEGMKALGLANGPSLYNKNPSVNDEGFVNQSDFIFEANSRLLENLQRMVRIPKKWEENRLLWKRRMERKKPREKKKKAELDDISEYQVDEEEEEEVKPREPTEIDETKACLCTCVPNMEIIGNGPVQLFLD